MKTETSVSEHEVTRVESKALDPSFSQACLYVTSGQMKGKVFAITQRPFFIGRSRGSDLILTDRSVSRRHAVINCVNGQYTISDLNSLTGTYVNGSKISETVLHNKDTINIGENSIRFLRQPASFLRKQRLVKKVVLTSTIAIVCLVLLLGIQLLIKSWKQQPVPLSPNEEALIQQHYERGIELFNSYRDVKGAIQSWRETLKLDPQRQSVYTRKAARMIEKYEFQEVK